LIREVIKVHLCQALSNNSKIALVMKPIMNTSKEQLFIIRLSIPFLVAFIALRHLFHELHESAHMIVGRVVCGAWGTRDFNNVHPMVDKCAESHSINVLIGLEGPFVNYVAIWLGTILIRTAKSSNQLSWGLTLIFANLPFARFITTVFGGGDELGKMRNNMSDPMMARLTVIVLISALLIYPLYTAFQALPVKKHKIWWFLGFLLLPMLLEGMVVLLFFNYLLKIGILKEIWIMGAPLLVSVVLIGVLIIFSAFAQYINTLVRKQEESF
jgi:hypothetical protein